MVVVKKPARKMALGVKFLLHKHEFRRQALPDVKATHSKEHAQNPSAEEQKPADPESSQANHSNQSDVYRFNKKPCLKRYRAIERQLMLTSGFTHARMGRCARKYTSSHTHMHACTRMEKITRNGKSCKCIMYLVRPSI